MEMDLSLILIGVGIVFILLSFFMGRNNTIDAAEVERISVSLHQETHSLKKRIQTLEEELMLSMEPIQASSAKIATIGHIHEIIINQILSLNSQGFSIEDIARRSSLSSEEVLHVLQARGVV